MNSDPQDFEPLRRLLAIKRHEQPPPGYFDRFSREVIARIKAGEGAERAKAGGWWQKIWGVLEGKPVFAGALGAAVCAVLISGLLNAETSDASSGIPASAQGNPALYPPAVPVMALNGGTSTAPLNDTLPVSESTLGTASSNPESLNSLFNFQGNVQPASFAVPGN